MGRNITDASKYLDYFNKQECIDMFYSSGRRMRWMDRSFSETNLAALIKKIFLPVKAV